MISSTFTQPRSTQPFLKRSLLAVALVASMAITLSAGAGTAAATVPSEWSSVSAGQFHTCGVTSSGQGLCWGRWADGQTFVPAPPAQTWASISAGASHDCGVTTTGEGLCWGSNSAGQTSVPSDKTWASISAGTLHSCGVTTGGEAFCWGDGSSGQLAVPEALGWHDPPYDWASISAGNANSCGVTTDGLGFCWGQNGANQNLIPSGKTWASLTTSSYSEAYTCGVTTTGEGLCWGSALMWNSLVPEGKTWASISPGNQHTCGLTTSGEALCWGDGEAAQYSRPDRTWTAISSGFQHSCGITTIAEALCWGSNSNGQLMIDTVAPATPSNFSNVPTGTIRDNYADIYFEIGEADGTVECRLDQGSWGACTTIYGSTYGYHRLRDLPDGVHSVSVRQTDSSGNASEVATTESWTVDSTPPTTPGSFTGVPSGPTRATTATIGFTLGEAGGTVECSPDGQGWGACTSISSTTGSQTMSDLGEYTHILYVRQIDAAGNTSDTASSNTWIVDITPPSAPSSFYDMPASPTSARTATIGFYLTESSAGGTVECRLDSGTWGNCTTVNDGNAFFALTGLAGGTHTISARQTDAAGNVSAVATSTSWTIDLTAPTTPGSFTGVPSAPTNVRTATIGFTLGESGGTVECRLNSGTWGSCSSVSGTTGSYSLSSLTAGSKTVSVRQTDSVGNVSAIGTSASWTVDFTAPSTPGAISGVPSSPSKATSATLTFTTTESGGTIQCKLDSGAWNACTSFAGTSGQFAITGLTDGAHTAYVRQTDAAGNVSATRTSTAWTVDATAPAAPGSFSGTPSSITNRTNESIGFTLAESGGTAQCRLDSGSWIACSSISGRNGSFDVGAYGASEVRVLSEGTHTVSVRQTDAAGNVGAIGTSSSWTIDRTAPAAPGSFTGVPSVSSNATTLTIGFTLAEAVSSGRIECALDAGDWVDCTSSATGTSASYTVAGLTQGDHSVSVRQTDAAGNTSSTSTTNTWTVDTTSPSAPSSLGGVPPSPTRITIATITFALAEAIDGGKVECRLDSDSWADCTSGVSGTAGSYAVSALANGSHSVSVRQTDAAGNVSTVSTTSSWTVDSATTIPEFVSTGSMAGGRAFHTSTLLPNGKVLVAGGYRGATTTSAELYDPATGLFTATGSMNLARQEHTATLLTTGKVLVVGVGNVGQSPSAELYDPATGLFTATGSMQSPGWGHTSTLLSNGKVLIAGGTDVWSPVSRASLYDPATGIFTATGNMTSPRTGHTATLLSDGKVLLAGGYKDGAVLSTADLYDPATGTFTSTGAMTSVRNGHSATLLANGKVLMAGGNNNVRNISSAELYNPATGTFTATGSMTSVRGGHTAVLLSGGKALIAGGNSNSGTLTTAELYDPATGLFTATRGMAAERVTHTITLLANGNLLVAGGSGGRSSAEIYYADLPPTTPGSLTGVPSGTTTSTSATIGFTLGEAVSGGKVECRLDSGTWVDCTSRVTGTTGSYALTGLADGVHTVSIRQTDAAGNVSSIATTGSWTVDTSAPSTPSLSGAPSGTTNSTSATLTFSGDSDTTFTCSIDGGAYTACASPLSLTGLSDGAHSISIKSTDAAGNTTTRSASWTVDTSAPSTPSLSGAPSGTTSSTSATLTFAGDEDSTITCSIDGGAYTACTSPLSLTGLTDGSHSVVIKSTDTAGNSMTRSASWTVDTSAPSTPSLSGAPSGTTSSTSETLTFAGDEDSTFTCSIDGGAYTACTSPLSLTGLSSGGHSVSIKSTDAAGNSTTRSASWTVNTTAPATPSLSGAPSGTTILRTARILFSGASYTTFTCSIDGRAYSSCSSPLSLTGLTDGNHSVSIRSTNAAGGVSSVLASWSVDATAPTAAIINGLPGGVTVSPNATATFSNSEPGVTFECRLNATGPITACTSPWELRGLAAGSYTAYVRTKDAAGNTGPWTSNSWTVRTPCPRPTLLRPTFRALGHGQVSIKPIASANDIRPACQLLTVQTWDGAVRPSKSEHLSSTPSFAMRIAKYALLVKFDGGQTFVPKWIRVENKVGTWSDWYALRKTTG